MANNEKNPAGAGLVPYDHLSIDPFSNKSCNRSVNDFLAEKKIGEGQFGMVYLAKEKKTGQYVAIKRMLKSKIVADDAQLSVTSEINIQLNLAHPNILCLLNWFKDNECVYLVLEYAERGELYKLLMGSPGYRFPEAKTASYIHQIVTAVEYIHSKHVLHRDIKPENILVTLNGQLKLADFGYAQYDPSKFFGTSSGIMCGTLDYMSPEMVKSEPYGATVDHWSIGVMLFEFLVGKVPFYGANENETFQNILRLELRYPKYVSEDAKDLISKLLQKKGTDRLPLGSVKSHSWMQKFICDEGASGSGITKHVN